MRAVIPGMKWIPGGRFRMGSDLSYPEEGPAHDVTVAGFWIDEYALTNADFAAFVNATGYVTVAERPLDPAAFPGARPGLLQPGAAVFFMPSGRVNMRDLTSRWVYVPGAELAPSRRPSEHDRGGRTRTGGSGGIRGCRRLCPMGG
jgi:formylglycine-generating enzyme